MAAGIDMIVVARMTLRVFITYAAGLDTIELDP